MCSLNSDCDSEDTSTQFRKEAATAKDNSVNAIAEITNLKFLTRQNLRKGTVFEHVLHAINECCSQLIVRNITRYTNCKWTTEPAHICMC